MSAASAPGVRVGPRLAWLTTTGRVFAKASPGRFLYRLMEGKYVFVGDRLRVCDGCGGVTPRAEGGRETVPCSLCGAMPAAGAPR